jgi:phage-related protein/DNA-binding XRE family transcriptional regulator
MPPVRLVLFRESDGTVPLIEWLEDLPSKSRVKCIAWLERLRNLGHELRRPDADYLRDGIYELRIGLRGVNYRILYFFNGREVVVASHGLVKERVVPPKEIDRAVQRMYEFQSDPELTVTRTRNVARKRRKSADAIDILHRRFIDGRPDEETELAAARADIAVAEKLRGLRAKAGLSQRELAKLVGTTASVICRLEDADYEGHSLAMLNRIAAALDKRVEIRFLPIK